MRHIIGPDHRRQSAALFAIAAWSCLLVVTGCSGKGDAPTQASPGLKDAGTPDITTGPDSTGGEQRGLLYLRADLEGLPLGGMLVAAVAQDGQRFEGTTADGLGAVRFCLEPGVYTIEAEPNLDGQEAPWLHILSIDPAVVTVGEMPAVSESVIHAGYNPGVPVPPGELIVQVGGAADGRTGAPPVPPTAVTIYRAGTSEVAAQGSTGDDARKSFELAAGSYDVSIEVPAGRELLPQQENPLRAIAVAPARTSWASFVLKSDTPGDSDSTGIGPRGLLRVRAELEGAPLGGFLLTVVAQDGRRFDWTTAGDGVAIAALQAGTYTIEAEPNLNGGDAPWLRIVSVEPAVVTVAGFPAESEAVIRVGYDPDVPLPPGELTVVVAAVVDSTNGTPPVPTGRIPLPTAVSIYRAGTTDLVAEGNTGTEWSLSFSLPAGSYDVAIDVPTGYELPAFQENPLRSVVVTPQGTAWIHFMLWPKP
jgi:hypothetical protein